MGCYAVAAMLEEPPSVACRHHVESSAHRLNAVAIRRWEKAGEPVAVQVSSRRVSLLAASRAVRNPLPPSCVLVGRLTRVSAFLHDALSPSYRPSRIGSATSQGMPSLPSTNPSERSASTPLKRCWISIPSPGRLF